DFGYKSILPVVIDIQPDGKFLVSVSSVLKKFFQRFWTARFLANGNIDSDFGINGLLEVSFNETLNDKTYNSRSVLQKDGRFLSSGSFEKSGKANFVLFRVVTGLTLSVADEQSFAPQLTARINDEGSIDVITYSKTHLHLYDMSGRLIGEYIVYPGKQTLPIHLNSRGTYILLAERNKTLKLIRY
ncbi:MAG: hypothetical protein NZ522_06245, partial [Chitinophagales bacterium]|nr:hypothetical protein [Chitinophagales bacterium]